MTPQTQIVAPLVRRAASLTGYTPEQICGPSRWRDLCRTRFAVMYAAHRAGKSAPQIGRVLGNRDHSTILSGLKRAVALAQQDRDFAVLVRKLGEVA